MNHMRCCANDTGMWSGRGSAWVIGRGLAGTGDSGDQFPHRRRASNRSRTDTVAPVPHRCAASRIADSELPPRSKNEVVTLTGRGRDVGEHPRDGGLIVALGPGVVLLRTSCRSRVPATPSGSNLPANWAAPHRSTSTPTAPCTTATPAPPHVSPHPHPPRRRQIRHQMLSTGLRRRHRRRSVHHTRHPGRTASISPARSADPATSPGNQYGPDARYSRQHSSAPHHQCDTSENPPTKRISNKTLRRFTPGWPAYHEPPTPPKYNSPWHPRAPDEADHQVPESRCSTPGTPIVTVAGASDTSAPPPQQQPQSDQTDCGSPHAATPGEPAPPGSRQRPHQGKHPPLRLVSCARRSRSTTSATPTTSTAQNAPTSQSLRNQIRNVHRVRVTTRTRNHHLRTSEQRRKQLRHRHIEVYGVFCTTRSPNAHGKASRPHHRRLSTAR